jgi:hypothetical protein
VYGGDTVSVWFSDLPTHFFEEIGFAIAERFLKPWYGAGNHVGSKSQGSACRMQWRTVFDFVSIQ